MKNTFKTSLILFLFVCSWGFCAFAAEQIGKTIKVSLSTAYPPQARTTGTVGANITNARSLWLLADIKFKTKDEKNAARRFLDNPVLDIQIAVYPSKRAGKTEKAVIFSGKIDYITLERDGREHYLKALLPSLLFRKYAYDRQLDRTDFVVKVSYSAGGKVLGTAYGSNKSVQEKEIRNFFNAVPRNAVQAPGTVWGRQGTTWSIIEVNKYEMEKLR